MPRSKANDEVLQKVKKKSKSKVSVNTDETCYVDANRNISVNLSESELSKALKDFDTGVI